MDCGGCLRDYAWLERTEWPEGVEAVLRNGMNYNWSAVERGFRVAAFFEFLTKLYPQFY